MASLWVIVLLRTVVTLPLEKPAKVLWLLDECPPPQAAAGKAPIVLPSPPTTRLVGIITHVPELKDEFDQRLLVTKDGAEPEKKEASDCALACRAFQSLTRAVDAVCRLDSGGERCSRARHADMMFRNRGSSR